MIRIVGKVQNKFLRPVYKKDFFKYFAPQLPTLPPKSAKSTNKTQKNILEKKTN